MPYGEKYPTDSLKRKPQPCRYAPRCGHGSTRKQSREIEHVHPIRQILPLHLQPDRTLFLAVNFPSRRRAQRKVWPQTPFFKIHLANDRRAVLLHQKIYVHCTRIELNRQTTPVFCADREPRFFCGLKPDASAQRVSLILSYGETRSVR